MLISDYLFQKASRNRIPLNVAMELSPVCNFQCKMCYVRKTEAQIRKEGKTLAPWQKWLELAKELRQAGTLYLLLTGGEPFLYPGFRELYTELHKMGFLIMINTNGTMIDEDTVAWLKDMAPCRINLTLYGGSRETYGRICGNPAGYDRAMFALRSLKEAGIATVVNASMIPENSADLEAIMAEGKKLGLNTRVSTYMFPPVRRDAEESDSRLTPEESADMFMRKVCFAAPPGEREKFFREYIATSCPQSTDDWGAHKEEHMRCRAGRSSFWISWDGTMCACGLTPFPKTFNAFEGNVMEHWMELTEAVRSTPVLQACAGCELREICKPCAAMVYAESGKTEGRVPYLCRLAECTRQRVQDYLKEYDHGENKQE
ncbi:MAG: radical SAM protein [Oscillospiraceae bacterium]|nr:radical SAM protein [Oscillospiraceae bacterium]